MLSREQKETLSVRLFAMFKVPMLGYISPKVIEINENRCIIRVPLKRRTKNHLGSMYFGALSAGADCAAGIFAKNAIERSKQKISFLFKDFKADFLKRAEGHVYFTCEQGEEIKKLVEKAIKSGQRENLPVSVIATVPDKLDNEPVAKFTLTLSIKKRK